MARYLVIVESPAKVKTIKKFLGTSYVVMASNGHVRDLPKSTLGIDVEHDFEPKYITIRGKGDILSALRKEVKKADKVYLATDPDREGEAIAWHLYIALKLEEKKVYRISFNEITKDAIKASIKEAREIDMSLVDAQQARRVLDRIVGYELSPFLWKKVKSGLSAGRVQSVAVKIIVDREREIRNFVPSEYWNIDAHLKIGKPSVTFKAKFYGDANGKIDIANEEQTNKILAELEGVDYIVDNVKNKLETSWSGISGKVSSIFESIKNAMTKPIDAAKSAISSAIDKIKSVLSEKNEAVFPTVFSERTQNQLKNIQEMLDKGYNVAFIIVSLNPYIKKLTIDKSTQFYSELTRCIEKGMEIRAYTSHLKDYEIEIKKQIPLLYL